MYLAMLEEPEIDEHCVDLLRRIRRSHHQNNWNQLKIESVALELGGLPYQACCCSHKYDHRVHSFRHYHQMGHYDVVATLSS